MTDARTITFEVAGVPVAQPRQRHRIAGGKTKNQFVQSFTPAKAPVNVWKATAKLAAREAYDGPPLQGPIQLTAVFVFPRPKRLIWKRQEMPRVPHTSKPDGDNLIKSLLDSLNKQVWGDDAQVCDYQVKKWIAAGDEQPHTVVTIQELTQ